MSHFSVLVIGDDVAYQLAPFQENNMDDCPEEFLEFVDEEDKNLQDYMTGSSPMVRLHDGTHVYRWDERFRVPGSIGFGTGTHRVPDELAEVDVLHRDRFPTFEVYMAEYCGHEKRDPKKGRYGRWENPNKRWDWYVVGGRWGGAFRLKPGRVGTLGQPSTFDRVLGDKRDHSKVDRARKGDIDFDTMRAEAAIEAQKEYRRLQSLMGGQIPKLERAWNDVLNDATIPDIDQMRELYWNQPALKELTRVKRAPETSASDREFLTWLEYERFQVSEEEFVERAKRTALITFAVVKDRQWFERGQMGWWGVTRDEKSEEEWEAQFAKLLDELPDDVILTMVDCHI